MAEPTNDRHAPYLAWRTFFNLIGDLEKGLPARIDRSYLSNRSGADQSYLIKALRTFGLIGEDNAATEPLKRLVADREGRPAAIADLLRANYPEVFALSPNATQAQLDEVFRDTFSLSGATLRKAETFLLHAAGYAEMKLSPHFKAARGISAGGGRPARRSARRARNQRDESRLDAPLEETPSGDERANMRRAYFELLRKKAEDAEQLDTDLLDRMERLIGLEVPRTSDQ